MNATLLPLPPQPASAVASAIVAAVAKMRCNAMVLLLRCLAVRVRSCVASDVRLKAKPC